MEECQLHPLRECSLPKSYDCLGLGSEPEHCHGLASFEVVTAGSHHCSSSKPCCLVVLSYSRVKLEERRLASGKSLTCTSTVS